MSKETSLKDKINQEMSVDYTNVLDKNFNAAKQFVRIMQEGKVDVIVKDRLTGKDQIRLYLLGKLYAKESGRSVTDHVKNKELEEELGVKTGSLLPWLKDLRDNNLIKAAKDGLHFMPLNMIERTLREIKNKMDADIDAKKDKK